MAPEEGECGRIYGVLGGVGVGFPYHVGGM